MHWGIRLRCRLCMEESRKAVLRLRSAIKVEEGEKTYKVEREKGKGRKGKGER